MLKFYDSEGYEIKKDKANEAWFFLSTSEYDREEINDDLPGDYYGLEPERAYYWDDEERKFRDLWELSNSKANFELIEDTRRSTTEYALMDVNGYPTKYADDAYFVYIECDSDREQLLEDYYKDTKELEEITGAGTWFNDGDKWFNIDTILDSEFFDEMRKI